MKRKRTVVNLVQQNKRNTATKKEYQFSASALEWRG